jgi:DNA invertase Pin-like site-specific DNA recombinase
MYKHNKRRFVVFIQIFKGTMLLKFIAYYRVSTERQGRSGLGLAAQKSAIMKYLNGGDWQLTEDYTDVESGKNNDRPELAKALNLCQLTGARLVVAKLDRLSRNASFLLQLRDAGVPFVCADMPDANELTIGIMALVAQQEREAISKRTKEALAAAKARGVKLGNPNGALALLKHGGGPKAAAAARKRKADKFAISVASTLAVILHGGNSTYRRLTVELNKRGILSPRGGEWTPATTRNVILRARALRPGLLA